MPLQATTHKDLDALQAWARAFYFGGFELRLLVQGEVEAVAIIGSHTSGLPSSEISIFLKRPGQGYRLQVSQAKVNGMLSIKETRDSVSFLDPAGKVILVVPWEGLRLGLQ